MRESCTCGSVRGGARGNSRPLPRLKRREFITLLGGGTAWPLVARAQQQKPIIGWLTDALPPRDVIDAFRRGLAEVGFLEGRDVTVEYHTTDGHSERLSPLLADLVLRRVR